MRRLGSRFERFWLATSVSALGDGLLVVGLPLLTRQITEDPLLIAGVFAAGRAPWAFGLLLGALADRRDAKRVLIAMDLSRATVLAVFGVWMFVGDRLPPLVAVYILAIVVTTSSVAYYAAAQRMLPMLVSDDQLEFANGYLDAAVNTGEQFVGPALGSAFAAGGRIPVVGDAISFAASAVALRGLPSVPAETPSTGGLAGGVIDGWQWFRRSDAIFTLTAVSAAAAAFSSFALANEVVVVTDTLGLATYWFGPFTAVIATGAILGGIVAQRFISRLRSSTLGLAAVFNGIAVLACAGSRSPVVVFAALGVQSFVIAVNNVSSASIRQRAIPAEVRGRVTGLARSFVIGVTVPGGLCGGWIAKHHGTDWMFGIAGGAMIFLGVVIARPLRRLLAPYQAPLSSPKAAAA